MLGYNNGKVQNKTKFYCVILLQLHLTLFKTYIFICL